MIDWQLAVGLIAFVVLCVVLFWIEAQAEDELVHEPHRDLVAQGEKDAWEVSSGRVRTP